MNYKIAKLTAGSPGYIAIDDVEYLRIKAARNNLFEILFVEEKFDYVTENFFEYETEILSISSRVMIFGDDDYFSMSGERNLISRRLVNLLTVCRMYLDQSAHHLTNIYGKNSEVLKTVKRQASIEYNQRFGYRVMDALRNYAQHCGFPIHSMKFSLNRVETGDEDLFSHAVVPLIKVSEIEKDKEFKPSVLTEMRAVKCKDGLDIRPLVREYIEGIGNVHRRIRELTRSDAEAWECLLNFTISRFRETFEGSSVTGLAIVTETDEDHWTEKLTIFNEFIEKRRSLERKNRYFTNLHRSYVSNQT